MAESHARELGEPPVIAQSPVLRLIEAHAFLSELPPIDI